jgi:hypothetical protein
VRDATTTPAGWAKEDGTDEGRLIRLHREALTPKVRQQDLAARLGWSRDKIARIENGYGRARDDAGPTRYPADDTDLARVAAEITRMAAGYGTPDLGVAPEELDSIGRGGAAELLRSLLAVPQSAAQDPEVAVNTERLLAALGQNDEFVRFLASDTGTDGDPRGLAARTLAVAVWVENHPAAAEEGARRTG